MSASSPTRFLSRNHLVSSSILLAESILRLGLVALVSLWIAHQIGPAEFGVLNHASALVAMFWLAAGLGLETPLTTRVARTSDTGVQLGSAIALRVASGLVAAGAVLVVAKWMYGGDTRAVVLVAIVALAVPLSAPFVLDAWFKVNGDAVRPAAARLLGTLVACAAKVVCLLLGLGIVALAWTVALEALLIGAALYLAHRSATAGTVGARLEARRTEGLLLLRETWPFFLSAAVTAAYMKIDIILLGAQVTHAETGVYSLSQKLVEVLYIVPMIVGDVLYPQLVRHQDSALGRTDADPQAYFDLTVGSALLATLIAIALVIWLLPVVFGEPYRPTVQVFLLHGWACIGVAMAHARFKWMAATGHQRLAPWVTLIGLVLIVLGNVCLVPVYGVAGAAAATALAFLLAGYLASFAFPALRPAARMQTLALWPWGRLWRTFGQRSSRSPGGVGS